MLLHHQFPKYPAIGTQVIIFEAKRGAARRAELENWLIDARSAGASSTWLVPCDAGERGVWAGPDTWIESILPDLEVRAPELFTRHDSEIIAVLPSLRRRIKPRYVPLTEAVVPEESVRNYAMDRAYRLGHGLIDLLDKWHQLTGGGRWVVACEDFDRCGALVGRFFRELVRRRGNSMGLVLVVAVDPGRGDDTAAAFAPYASVERVQMDLAVDPARHVAPEEATRRVQELEQRVRRNTVEMLLNLPELIRLSTDSGNDQEAIKWHSVALGMYNHMGYYEDALRHASPVQASLAQYDPKHHIHTRWDLAGNLFGAYQANGRTEEARAIIERILEISTDPEERARAWYIMAMFHVRYLPERNPELGERCILQALEELDRADLDPADRHFMRVFALNGLALVRVRQGRPQEALDLTLSNAAHLDDHLPPDRHRLHRSVLRYNAGQVYARVGAHEDAIRSFSEAMEMDPNYSEYYNDRGNSYMQMQRYDMAARDYLQAIECSPPYPEVWGNLGYCYMFLGRTEEAERAFDRALDLDPGRQGARVGRAQARAALGRRDEALADYDLILGVDRTNPLVFANRAALRYDLGRIEGSLEDLDCAVALAPENSALRLNRSLPLEALGRREKAASDLEEYIRLRPDAPDRTEVERRLASLQGALEPA